MLRDLEDGIISLDSALNVYRVVIEPETMSLDREATRKLREKSRMQQQQQRATV